VRRSADIPTDSGVVRASALESLAAAVDDGASHPVAMIAKVRAKAKDTVRVTIVRIGAPGIEVRQVEGPV